MGGKAENERQLSSITIHLIVAAGPDSWDEAMPWKGLQSYCHERGTLATFIFILEDVCSDKYTRAPTIVKFVIQNHLRMCWHFWPMALIRQSLQPRLCFCAQAAHIGPSVVYMQILNA